MSGGVWRNGRSPPFIQRIRRPDLTTRWAAGDDGPAVFASYLATTCILYCTNRCSLTPLTTDFSPHPESDRLLRTEALFDGVSSDEPGFE